MAITRWTTTAAALAALVLALGCGEGGGSSSSGAPPAEAASAAQKAGPASGTATQTAQASSDALLNAGTNGATSTKAQAGGAQAPSPTFNFQASVSVVVDFDALDDSGQDAFPNVSGRLQVDATGTVTGDATSGDATYAVQTNWLTDGVFSDPACGAQATVAAGSGLSYTLLVGWMYVDSLNWSVQASSDFSAARTVTVTHGGETWTANGTVDRHAAWSIVRAAGAYTVSWSFTGQRTIVITDGVETHTVGVDVQALDRILITVDGVTYGPYTALQVLVWWRFDCEL
jgi:hypothetical protein